MSMDRLRFPRTTMIATAWVFAITACQTVTPSGDSGVEADSSNTAVDAADASLSIDSSDDSFAEDAARSDITIPDDAGPSDGCAAASDCRLVASYCATAPCVCLALSADAGTATCTSGSVECFADPCAQRTAMCVEGHCVAQ